MDNLAYERRTNFTTVHEIYNPQYWKPLIQSGRHDFQIGWAKPTFGQIFGWAGLVFSLFYYYGPWLLGGQLPTLPKCPPYNARSALISKQLNSLILVKPLCRENCQ